MSDDTHERSYECFYRDKRITVQANGSYAAQKKAADLLHVPEKRRYQVMPVLADYLHDPASLPGS